MGLRHQLYSKKTQFILVFKTPTWLCHFPSVSLDWIGKLMQQKFNYWGNIALYVHCHVVLQLLPCYDVSHKNRFQGWWCSLIQNTYPTYASLCNLKVVILDMCCLFLGGKHSSLLFIVWQSQNDVDSWKTIRSRNEMFLFCATIIFVSPYYIHIFGHSIIKWL